VATVLALAAVSFGVLQINANGIPQDKTFTKTQDSVTGGHVLADHFPAGTGLPTTIVAKADHLDEVLAQAQGPGIVDVVPYTGQRPGGGGLVNTSGPPTVVDGLVRLDLTLSVPPDSQQAHDAVVALRNRMHAIAGADAKVGGFSAVTIDVQNDPAAEFGVSGLVVREAAGP
jgi:RND superfamily putative drug exporter